MSAKHEKVRDKLTYCKRAEKEGLEHGLLTSYFNLNHNHKWDPILIYQMSIQKHTYWLALEKLLLINM